MKFEYDENGAKFVYFVLSFYAMIIIPLTYYLWPKKEVKSKFFYNFAKKTTFIHFKN